MPPLVMPKPDDFDARRIRRSRVISYVLVLLAAVSLSLRPELFGDPQAQPAHALLHVVRIVVGIALAAAALGVQIAVGLSWRKGLAAGAEDPGHAVSEPPGNRPPEDR